MDDAAHQHAAAVIPVYLADHFAMHPHHAVSAGLHQYDGQIADWSGPAIAGHRERVRAALQAVRPAAALPLDTHPTAAGAPTLDAAQQIRWDARLVLASAQAELFRWDVWRPQAQNPLIYLAPLDVSPYIKRDYAPLPERLRALVHHLAGMPALLESARAEVSGPVPRLVLDQSITMFDGLARFHATDLPGVILRSGETDLLPAFQAANQAAVGALRQFVAHLRGLLQGGGVAPMGADRLQGLIFANEGVRVAIPDLLARGRDALQTHHARMVEVAGRLGMAPAGAMAALGRRHPPAEQVVPLTRGILNELLAFLRAQDLVTVPGAVSCVVQETPPYMRTGSAFMDAPGPFETAATEAYYYLTLPDPAWPAAQREAWLTKQTFPGLTNTSAHEAWPGHYLQYLHLAQAPTTASKIFTCTSFTEGWAHYAEQMLIEAGHHADDPRYELHQLSMALLRDCRLIIALRLHTEGIAIAEAADFIAREAFFSPIRARQEAIRGARDPAYLNYALGKLLLLRLRDDLRRALPAWSTRTRHDALLAFGAPPIPLLREALLGEPADGDPAWP